VLVLVAEAPCCVFLLNFLLFARGQSWGLEDDYCT
jgi:hypothetical protein